LYPHLIHAFLDGGYVRGLAKEFGRDLVNPRSFVKVLAESGPIQTWAYDPTKHPNAHLARITYYDALADSPANRAPDLEEYWKSVELLDDVQLGFGALRGLARKVRQKGVDTLMAVEMVVGAHSGIFDIALLVAGDADFVPVVEEVRKHGVMVALAAAPKSLSDDLRRAADRFVEVQNNDQSFPPMRVDGRTWPA